MAVRGFHPDRKWDEQAEQVYTEQYQAVVNLAGPGTTASFVSFVEFKLLSELITEFRAKGLDEAADLLEGKHE